MAQKYFHNLFSTTKPSRIEECVGYVDDIVLNEDMKVFLDRPFVARGEGSNLSNGSPKIS